MIVSRYTILFKHDGKNYTYNTLSNSFMSVGDDGVFAKLVDAKANKAAVHNADYGKDLYDALRRNKIITKSDADDFLIYKSIIIKQRAQRQGMHLTLAPTMDCCFRCHYCFEKYKRKVYMSYEVMDAIINYVTSFDQLKTVNITWFGGEPLMAIGQIEDFYDRLKSKCGDKELSSNVITSGYHINEEAIRVLNKVGVTSVQITLDGNHDTHNGVKNFPGCDDVFERVLNNVDLYSSIAPNVNIVFRVNLTLKNAHEYEPLHWMILDRFKNNRNVAIVPAFVQDRGKVGCKTDGTMLFNLKQQTEYILHLADRGVDSTFIRYPKSLFYECAIRNEMAIAFDPEGYAYKCWEIIGNKKYSIGKLNKKGALTHIREEVLNRQLYGADPLEDPKCHECMYLPVCNGGCPIQRIENVFDGCKNCVCTFYKGHMEEFLKEHIRRKKMGIDNR